MLHYMLTSNTQENLPLRFTDTPQSVELTKVYLKLTSFIITAAVDLISGQQGNDAALCTHHCIGLLTIHLKMNLQLNLHHTYLQTHLAELSSTIIFDQATGRLVRIIAPYSRRGFTLCRGQEQPSSRSYQIYLLTFYLFTF